MSTEEHLVPSAEVRPFGLKLIVRTPSKDSASAEFFCALGQVRQEGQWRNGRRAAEVQWRYSRGTGKSHEEGGHAERNRLKSLLGARGGT